MALPSFPATNPDFLPGKRKKQWQKRPPGIKLTFRPNGFWLKPTKKALVLIMSPGMTEPGTGSGEQYPEAPDIQSKSQEM